MMSDKLSKFESASFGGSSERMSPADIQRVAEGLISGTLIPVKTDSGPVVEKDFTPPPLRPPNKAEIEQMAKALAERYDAKDANEWLTEIESVLELERDLRAHNEKLVRRKIDGHFLVRVANGVIVESFVIEAPTTSPTAPAETTPTTKPTFWQKVKNFFHKGNLA